jgi:hypothetical protein
MLSALRAAPTDVRLFDRLRKGIDTRAASLGEADRKKISSVISAAELSYDVDQLAKALAILKRSGS